MFIFVLIFFIYLRSYRLLNLLPHLRFTIWEEKEAEFHDKLQKLKNPEVFEVCNLKSVVREIKECVTKVRNFKCMYFLTYTITIYTISYTLT